MADQIHTLNQEIHEDKVLGKYVGGGISGRGRGTDICFILKQPQYWEVKNNQGYTGEAGQFLLKHMGRKGFKPSQLYCTYMLKVYSRNRKVSKSAYDTCIDYLERELELVKPKLIVALGADVMRLFGIKGSINECAGRVYETEMGNVLVMRDPNGFNVPGKGKEVPQFVTQMDAIRTFLEGEVIPPPHSDEVIDLGSHYGIDVEVEDYESDDTAYLYSIGWSDGRVRMANKVSGELFTPTGIPVMHNAKYDIKWLESGGMKIDQFEDTMLQAALLGHKPLALKDLMAIHLGGEPDKFHKVVGSGKRRKQYDAIPEFLDYNSKDAWGTLALHNQYHPQLVSRGLEPIYEKEKKVLRVLLEMEQRGMPLDHDQLKDWRVEVIKEMGASEKALAAQGLSPSDQDTLRELFWKGKPNVRMTKKRNKLSLSKVDLLECAVEGDEWIHNYINWSEKRKFLNTYIDNWLGRTKLHPTFNQCGTQTWRFSCSNPNLQNVTKRGGSKLPYMFKAPDGYTFVSADASQGELREMGNQAYHYVGDSSIADSYANGVDMHSMSETIPAVIRVAEIKGQPVRTVAKSFNFKLLYGGTGPGMAQEYSISTEEGQAMIDGFYQKFPAIRDVHDEYIHQALTDGYVTTLAGRPLYVPQVVKDEGQFYERGTRQAKNFPIQGGLMEVIKDAMLKFQEYLVMQVHDELLWLVPDTQLESFVKWLEEELNSNPYDCIPYVWDIHTGKNWGEAKN